MFGLQFAPEVIWGPLLHLWGPTLLCILSGCLLVGALDWVARRTWGHAAV